MRTRLLTCASLVVLSGWMISSDACAQGRGSPGQNGQGGGSSMFPSGSTGGSSFNSSAFGSTTGRGGQSGLGQSGFGQQGAAQQGFGQSRGGFGAQNQNNGFLGVNTDPNNFLGRNTQGQGRNNVQGQNNLGRGGNQGGRRQLDSGLMSLLNGQQGGGGGGQMSQQPVIRPRQKVAFEYPQPKLDAVVTSTQTRLQKLAVRHPRLSDVHLLQEADGTVVLRGSSPSEADAKIAESMLRLEPGVRKIRNELTFPPPGPDAE